MKLLTTLALALTLAGTSALAKDVAGIQLPETTIVDGQKLELKGAGLRKKLVFDVYVVGLYLADPAKDPLSDQPKQVKLVMKRDLDSSQIAEAISEGFEKNSSAQLPKLKDRLNKLIKAVPAVKSGQVLTLTYVPGKGTMMSSGGKELVTLEGKDFADALFKVWLGKNPVDEGLRDAMLGKS